MFKMYFIILIYSTNSWSLQFFCLTWHINLINIALPPPAPPPSPTQNQSDRTKDSKYQRVKANDCLKFRAVTMGRCGGRVSKFL